MQIRRLLILISYVVILFSTFNTVLYSAPNIFVFHINGVNTSEDDARGNLKRLLDVVNNSASNVEWRVLYNPTSGSLLNDLKEVMRQKKLENRNLTMDDYVMVYMKVHHLTYPVGSKEYAQLKANIKSEYVKDLGFVGRDFATIVDEFHDKVESISQGLMQLINRYGGPRYVDVLFVPHSQGNLYANSLRSYLIKAEKYPSSNIAIYGVANPADKVDNTVNVAPSLAGDPRDKSVKYITGDDDFVINALNDFSRQLPVTNPPLPANVHLRRCNDVLCHSFKDAYLFDENSREIIAGKVNALIKGFA